MEEKDKPLKHKISITLDTDLLVELRTEARRVDRSLSSLINIILKNHKKNCNSF